MKLWYLKLKDKYWANWLFLFTVLIVYFVFAFVNFDYFLKVGQTFLKIMLFQILPVLAIVFILMFIFNLLLKKEEVKNFVKNSKSFTKYFFAVLGGIFSTWPVYMWYPFLKKLKEHWLSYGHIATFIYARAVKIPLLAAMVFYFGLKYTIVFNLVLIILSVLIWLLVDLIFNENNNENSNC